MDTFFSINLGPNTLWKVSIDDPEFVPLESFPHLNVINPLLHARYFAEAHHWGEGHPETLGVGESYAIVKSPFVLFGLEFAQFLELGPKLPDETIERPPEIMWPVIANGISRGLRHLSKQAGLRIDNGYSFLGSPVKIDFSLRFPKAHPDRNAFFDQYDLETAITLQKIVLADRNRGLDQPHVSNDLLLDAIQALTERDFRRSLLYSAIAMESYASEQMEKSYQAILEGDTSPSPMRVVSIPIQEGISQRKDPVYSFLAENKREFRTLLHEMPLYLLGRSLMVDDQPLYQQAHRLYKTRNKIVHSGEIAESDVTEYGFSSPDARAAIQTALDVCTWFGWEERYYLPGGEERIRLDSPTDDTRFDGLDNPRIHRRSK